MEGAFLLGLGLNWKGYCSAGFFYSQQASKAGRQIDEAWEGAKKTAVIGAVERGGLVVAESASDLSGKGVFSFILQNVKTSESRLITDEYKAYKAVDRFIRHEVV